jgi:hypothetical protein
MKKVLTVLLSVLVLLVIVASCSPSPEKAEAKVAATQTVTDSYDGTTKYACRHFKTLIANADVLTYQEQLKELKTVYTGMAIAYEDGNYQSGPMYYAARTAYSAAINNEITDETLAAMRELATLCHSVPNW